MPIVYQYLLKVSISLAIMYLFYQLVLRRLTFYNHNRWYLLGYSVLCYFISFINIGPILQRGGEGSYQLINIVPSVATMATNLVTQPVVKTDSVSHAWEIVTWMLLAGTALLMIRLVVQLVAFNRLKAGARLVSGEGIRFYQVNRNIIPFSFGNAIYINQNLHTEAELKEIIRHEFVHVKQRHTIDIIWGELLCIMNWYNPFVWLIRRAIRQNLEFIADSKVIANGIDKKQYQYLLLKVIGNSHFSIASQFNFTSLKKRIVMMNKIKTAQVHLFRFLFLLPLMAVILVAFRNSPLSGNGSPVLRYAAMVIDADTKKPLPDVSVLNVNTNKRVNTDQRGYFEIEIPADQPIHVKMTISKDGYASLETNSFSLEKANNSKSIGLMEVIAIKEGNAVDKCEGCYSSISMREEGNENLGFREVQAYYEKLLIGLPAFVDTVPGQNNRVRPVLANSYSLHRDDKMSDEHQQFFKRNTSINLLHWKKDGSLEVYLSGGKVRRFISQADFKNFESEYGPLPEAAGSTPIAARPPEPIPPAAPPASVAAPSAVTPAAPPAPPTPVEPVRERVNITGTMTIDETIKPLIVVDGNEWPAHLEMNLLDPAKIESVSILKGESAMSKYGNKGKNGVVMVSTKKSATAPRLVITGGQPSFYLNGKKVDRQSMELIDPARIYSIDVLKDKKAIEKYGDDGKNGAVEINTVVPPAGTNITEKPVTNAWDVPNILPGKKKKDEC